MLKKNPYSFYSTPSIRPTGWLRRQLEIQAAGLTSRLAEFWPDIRDSAWIGGTADGWERVPYWLDGLIPLAWLLDDQKLKATATRYIDGIIAAQEEDGWICPCEDRGRYDVWAYLLILKVLVVYHRATGDDRIEEPIRRALRCLDRHVDGHTLFGWAQTRWYEGLVAVFWLYERSGEEWLLHLAAKLRGSGFDWKAFFGKSWPYKTVTEKTHWGQFNHVVNNAMMLKGSVLYGRISGDASDTAFGEAAFDTLMRYHGMVTGVFTGDECLDGDSPFQGTELCAVAELMYSFEHIFAVTGDGVWGDRLEAAAFNAFPATFTPDMNAHQYDQQVNQPFCRYNPKPNFGTNGPESNLFGVEPNYGCCTSNMHQGWPKFAESVFMRAEDGVAVLAYAPAELRTEIDGVPVTVAMDTVYPFRETVRFTVSCDRPVSFRLRLRIPGWCKAPGFGMEGRAEKGFYVIDHTFDGRTEWTVTFPMEAKLVSRPRNARVLTRGPLVYSLYIKERAEKQRKEGEPWWMENDELYNESEWKYAFDLEDPSALAFEEREPGDYPFSPDGAAVSVQVPCRPVEWEMDGLVPADLPGAVTGEREEKRFIPYGCTLLRMTEMVNAADQKMENA